MKKNILGLFKKNNVDNENKETALNIAELSKKLQDLGENIKPVPIFFHTSKGELIDLRTKPFVSSETEMRVQQQDTGIKSKPIKTTIFDFIQNVKDKKDFLKDLKSTFNIETNTEIAIVIDLFEKEKIICYNKFAPFYREIKTYLNRDIGKQNTINDAIKRIQNGTQTRETEFVKITEKANGLIIKHKT